MIALANATVAIPHPSVGINNTLPSCFFPEAVAPTSPKIPEPYSKDQIANAKYVEWVVYPILLAICTFGNGIALFVLAQEQPKGSTNIYMMTVAISDLVVMWMTLPTYQYTAHLYLPPKDKNYKKSSLALAYHNYKGINTWLQEAAIQVSDWTLFVFSLERFYALVQPFKSRGLNNARTALVKCGVVVLLCLLMVLFDAVSYYYDYNPIPSPKRERPCWLSDWSHLQERAEPVILFSNYFGLLVVNLGVIIVINRALLIHKSSSQQQTSKKRYTSSNLLLLGSVALLILSQLPCVVDNCMRLLAKHNPLVYPDSTQRFAQPIVSMFFLVNYSANCYVYLLVSNRFRSQLAAVFAKWRVKLKCIKHSPSSNILKQTGTGKVTAIELDSITQQSNSSD